MSRLLMAASARFARYIRVDKIFLNNTRQLAAAKKPADSTSPKCPSNEEESKPKPGYFPSGGIHAVFSDLPQPEGDFMQAWHAKNTKYNLIMISGILALIGTIVMGKLTGLLEMHATVPEYPYNEDEMEEFTREEERRQEEKEAREQRRADLIEAKELSQRRRLAKEAMTREVELMQKDVDEGIDDTEMAELEKLAQEREEFEKWEAEEVKRLQEQEKEREKIRKEKEKVKAEREKEREKQRKEKDKQLEKEEQEREKQREKARKEREKQRKEEEKEAERARKAQKN